MINEINIKSSLTGPKHKIDAKKKVYYDHWKSKYEIYQNM